MEDNKPATHVDHLLTKVRRSTERIRKHRQAMEKIAAQAAANNNANTQEGGNQQ